MLTISYAYFCLQQAKAGADPVRLPFLRFKRYRQARNLRRASEIPMQTMPAQLRIPLRLDGLPFEAEALQDQVQGQGLHRQAQPGIHSGPVPCEQEHGPALEKEVPAGGLGRSADTKLSGRVEIDGKYVNVSRSRYRKTGTGRKFRGLSVNKVALAIGCDSHNRHVFSGLERGHPSGNRQTLFREGRIGKGFTTSLSLRIGPRKKYLLSSLRTGELKTGH